MSVLCDGSEGCVSMGVIVGDACTGVFIVASIGKKSLHVYRAPHTRAFVAVGNSSPLYSPHLKTPRPH